MARLFYDLTGLLHWYAYFRRPAGVQRVIEQVGASDVLQRAAAPLPSGCGHTVEFVLRGLGSDRFFRLDPAMLVKLKESRPAAILDLRRNFVHGLRQASVREVFAAARYFHLPYLALALTGMDGMLLGSATTSHSGHLQLVEPPTARDAYFNPGDLWWQNDYAAALAGLKKRTGVRILQMIHDLYVLQRPDWSPRGFSAAFARQLGGIGPHVDRWLTSSAHVKGLLGDCLDAWAMPPRPISVLPMGWDSFHDGMGMPAIDDQVILDRHGVGCRPFILFVGTVEPRKNLASLLDAMASVRRRLGLEVPVLVIAGGYGWRAASVRRRLRQGMRDGHLLWVRNLDDGELRALYKRALFTVMPSHGEGWGLAVQESIALGVPCIATSGGATREAGRDLAIYVDPSDPRQLEAAIAAWLVDHAALAEARARIARTRTVHGFPTWNDAARLLLAEAFGDD